MNGRIETPPTHRCPCVDVEIGGYAALVELVPPEHLARNDGRGICVDACLALEITRLWRQGIRTTGCCCGHNQTRAFIGVAPEEIARMKALGYEVSPNPSRPGDQDSFFPLSLEAR